jgi:hypothetical protein
MQGRTLHQGLCAYAFAQQKPRADQPLPPQQQQQVVVVMLVLMMTGL